MNVKVTIDFNAAGLSRLAGKVTGPQSRARLSERMGLAVREKTREHLAALAGSRHATAIKLGASPSGHLEQAARAVESAPVAADPNGATLTINHVGMIRALRDVTITPRQSQCLAIPVNAIAYNRRPAELWTQLGLFIAKGMIMMPGPDGPIALYKLVKSVHQKQDRTLLPSGAEWTEAAADGARSFFDQETPS